MPLHDPVRVAEDAAVVDLISGGRLILGIGLGYRQEEFSAFGRTLRERRGRMEESIEILQKGWADEPFSLDGKYYKLENTSITPKPIQKPIPIWIGAFTEPSIRRAARIGAPLACGAPRRIRQESGGFRKAARTGDVYIRRGLRRHMGED